MSADDYFDRTRLEVGRIMTSKLRVYLDTKYWVYLREAGRDRTACARKDILALLEHLVETGKVICPLSGQTFVELLKQRHRESRLAGSKIMDRLSKQICFISPTQIVGQEIITFVRNRQAKSQGHPPFNNVKYIWTKVPFILGELYPKWDGIPEVEQKALRESFLDYLSKKPLQEIIELLPDRTPARNYTELIDRLNKGKDANQSWQTFHQVFMHEIVAALDVLREELGQVWRYLLEVDAGMSVSSETVQRLKSHELLTNVIYRAFDDGKVGRELPYIYVRGIIHAHYRYDKNRRYKENDINDIGHSAWALPYCQYFFTEDSFAAIITQTKLDSYYGTTVLSKEGDVLGCLSKLA
jgi:hypothetical protein